MKKGALSAATEFNIDITFEGPDNEEDYEAQNRMIENAVSRNVGAIILSAIDYEKNAPAVRKAAEKGNHQMSAMVAKALIDELLSLENPYNCPHGRPTIISMSKYELEKKFKRIV